MRAKPANPAGRTECGAPAGAVRLCIGLLTLLLAAPLVAQESDELSPEDRATQLAEQARDAFVAGDYVQALQLYDQTFELDPHPVIAYNQARCYEELGDLPRALQRFRAALDLDPGGSISEQLQAKIAEIEAALVEQGVDLETLDPDNYVAVARLTVTSVPPGAVVTVDGEPVGATPIDGLFVSPGDHRVELSLDGYQDHIRSLIIEAGRNVTVHASLRRLGGIGDYTPPDPGFLELTGPRRGMSVYIDEELIGETPLSGQALPPGRFVVRVTHEDFDEWTTSFVIESGQTVDLYADNRPKPELQEGWGAREWGIATGVAGGVFALTGTVFGVLALADASQYADNPEARDRADIRDAATREALLADVSFGLAGACLVTAGILLFVVDSDSGDEFDDSDDLVRVDVFGGAEGAGIQLGGRF